MRIIDTNYNLNGTVDTNIVHISDIHYYNKKCIKRLNKILEKIKKIKPNYICITGDITDESRVYNEEIFEIKQQEQKVSTKCSTCNSIGIFI